MLPSSAARVNDLRMRRTPARIIWRMSSAEQRSKRLYVQHAAPNKFGYNICSPIYMPQKILASLELQIECVRQTRHKRRSFWLKTKFA